MNFEWYDLRHCAEQPYSKVTPQNSHIYVHARLGYSRQMPIQKSSLKLTERLTVLTCRDKACILNQTYL